MKKSKAIAIGLLALSITACHKKEERKDLNEWNQTPPRTYVNDGNGYHSNGISPFWIFFAYQMGANRNLSYQPAYGYRSQNGIYHTSSNGQSYASKSSAGFGSHSTAGRATSRGGFGSSGSSHSVGA